MAQMSRVNQPSPGVPTCRGINKTRTCGKGLVSNKDVPHSGLGGSGSMKSIG